MAIQIDTAASLPASPTQNTSSPEINRNQVASTSVSGGETVPAQPSAVQAQADKQALEASVSNMNDFVQNVQRSIHFSVAENSGRTVIEVYDKNTDELIRTIPSEEVQRISDAIAEQLSEGLLLKINI